MSNFECNEACHLFKIESTANVMNHTTTASSYHIEDVQYSNQMTRFVYQKENSRISSPPPRQIISNFYQIVATLQYILGYGILTFDPEHI